MHFNIFFSLVFVVGISSFLSAQNLLPNPGFEEPNSCHKYEEECCPMGWWSTGPKLVKYQRYNTPGKPSLAAEGKAHMSLLLYDQARSFDRKFIQAPLICPLVSGEEYAFSAYIKTDYYRIDHIGILFRDSLFFAKKNDALQESKPSLLLSIPPDFPADQWLRLEGRFVAQGGERFIIIGNFETDEQTNLSPINPKALKKRFRGYYPAKQVRYSIDQLSLSAVQAQNNCDLNKNLEAIRKQNYRHSRAPKAAPPKILEPVVEQVIVLPIEPVIKEPELKLKKGHSLVLKNVNFEFGTAVLLPSSFEELKAIAQTLIHQPQLQILIKGHTDHIGDASHNQILSKERAKTVYTFLVRKGIDRNRMDYKGYGEIQPIASNEKEEGRQINRRVEIEVLD